MCIFIEKCAGIVLSSRRLRLLLACLAGSLLACDAAQAQITYLKSWGTPGSGDGQFSSPDGVAISPDGDVYVSDSGNNRIQKFDSQGGHLLNFGSGRCSFPDGVAVSADGSIVYVADAGTNNILQSFTSDGNWITSYDGGFNHPTAVAVSQGGDIYVADEYNHRIVKIPSSGSTSSFPLGIGMPSSVAVSLDNEVYTSDFAYCVEKYTSAGVYDGRIYPSGLNPVQLDFPSGVATQAKPGGDVYVVDNGTNRIQKFDTSGNFLAKFGTSGSGDGQFSMPNGIAVSCTGEIYIADSGNNRIQKWFDLDAWVSGTPHLDDAYIGTGQMLGQVLALDSNKGLLVDHVLAVLPDGQLIHNGTDITATYFQNYGWTSVGSSSNLNTNSSMTNMATGTLYVYGTVHVNTLFISGGGSYLKNYGEMSIGATGRVYSYSEAYNYNHLVLSNGQISVTGTNDQGTPYFFDNEWGAILDGTGTISAAVNNFGIINVSPGSTGALYINTVNNYGEINIPAGGHLTFDIIDNLATINISGGSAEADTVLENEAGGVISGKGSIFYLDNYGLVHATGSQLSLYWPAGNRASGELLIDGGATIRTVGSFTNGGLIQLASPSAVMAGDNIVNFSTIQGQGRISNQVDNFTTIRADGGQLTLAGIIFAHPGSTIEIPTGATVFVSGGLALNDYQCQIALTGGAFDNNTSILWNSGSIVGHGTFRSGSLINQGGGIIHFADGATNVFGPVENQSSAIFIQEGSSATLTTFYGFVTNDPGGTFQVLGGTVRFLGGTSGLTGMSNAGAFSLATASAATVQNGNGDLLQTTGGAIEMGDYATLTSKTLKIQGGTLSADGPHALITASLEYTSPESSTYAGILAGAGKTLTLNNPAATLALSGNNTYTGPTSNLTGKLELDSTGQIAASSAITNNDKFLIEGGTHVLHAISGTGATELSNAADVTLPSIAQNTLTIGAGATLTIAAIPGGPLAGMGSISPVPEPAAWTMLLLAAMGLGICRRRIW